MLKKLFKLVTVLSLLGACYIAYVQAFTFAVSRLRASRHYESLPFQVQDSQTKQFTQKVSQEAFGLGHWTDSDKLLKHYNSHRGLFLFTLKFTRPTEEGGVKFDGRRATFEPAAVVLKSNVKGGSTKTITSDRAVIDFNQSFGFNLKPGAEPTTVKYARLEGSVMIRDDRGTPDEPRDDMVIGPLTYVDYDDDKLQIRTDSDVLLVDRDLHLTGTGLEIQLRPKNEPTRTNSRSTGFDGAQRATLLKNIRMTFGDVGSTGMLPGAVKTKKDAEGRIEAQADLAPGSAQAKAKKKADDEAVPLDLQCDGPMVIELPSTPAPVAVGPPAPAAPTFVEFNRAVVVRRGKLTVDPDQLNCDTLHLTLLPSEPKPEKPKAETGQPKVQLAATEAPPAAAAAEEEKSVFGGLALRRAKASGYAVWLQLPGQGAKIRCVELLHHKDPTGGKNTTIFHGGGVKKLWVEKQDIAQDGPERGKVQSVTHVWCADATLMDDGDMNHATLVANGPGLLESRPGVAPQRETPPDRTAVWQDQLWLQNEVGSDGAITGKVLVLKGKPRIQDRLKQASLDSLDSIVVWFNNKKADETIKTADAREVVPAAFTVADPTAPNKALGGLGIRRLLAVKDVHLVAPSRDLHARNQLDVNFEEATITASPPAGSSAPASAPAPAQNPAPPAEFTPVPGQVATPPKPVEPQMTAVADRVEAKVVVGAKPATPAAAGPASGAPDAEYQIRNVELRGAVALHQDPEPGKAKGTDAVGEVLILLNEGPGKAIFDLYHHDPYSAKGRAVDPETAPRARVSTEQMTIEAKVIGINQKTDEAWAKGAGKLTQLTERGLLTDRSSETTGDGDSQIVVVDKAKKRAGKEQSTKVPITITWAEKMSFEGVSVDPLNRPAAKAKFYKNARAEMEDSLLYGGESITTYTDQPIPLAEAGKISQKPKTDAAGSDGKDDDDEKAKPDLALIECKGNAVAITRKVHPDRPVLISMQKLAVDSLTYDRRSGGFVAPGPGMVYLYDRGGDPTKPRTDAASATPIATSRTIRPTAFQAGEGDEKVAVRHADAVRRAPEEAKSLLAPLVLTQIKFQKEMRGRFGTGKQDDVNEQRWAEFYGGVETARAEVANERLVLDYDRLPASASFLTSEMLRVITEPPPPGAARSSGGRNFLKASDKAVATARNTTIQADVITYDSLNDLIYAYGFNGNTVQIVQQTANGQPGSPARVASVRLNPKTGAADIADPQALQLVDARTGVRPSKIGEPDPNAKAPPEPRKRPKRPPTNPAELKGFTGR